MQIPDLYYGRWSGLIIGDRENPYPGTITIDEAGVSTDYQQARTHTWGNLTWFGEREGRLIFTEIVSKKDKGIDVETWNGTLTLHLDAEGNLRCVWRRGQKLTNNIWCKSTMTRV